MASTKTKTLSLRESSRILRPVPVEHLTVPDSWNELIIEFEEAAGDGATGLVVISAAKGAGKSSFMKLLQRAMTKHHNVQVLFGSVVESISSSGWLMPFLSDILSGAHTQPLPSRAVLDRLQELTHNRGGIALFIDGADHITTDALATDLAGLMALVEDTQLQLLIVANASEAAASSLMSSPLLSHKSIMGRSLPRFTEDEMRDILQTRLEEAHLDSGSIKAKIQAVISQSQGIPAKALRDLIEVAAEGEAIHNAGAKIKSKPVQEPKNVPEPKAVQEPRPKRAKASKAALDIEESPKPSTAGKSENKNRQVSYDDLLTVKKLGS